MKSSISSCSDQLWNHDVYLSFRGGDTRDNFVDHLYTALDRQGILSYKDNETLTLGKPVGLSLLKTIKESRIVVVVFSKNYGNSSLRLDELEYIMKCRNERGQLVMPIFYHVAPSDVREQKGTYAEAFSRHELEDNQKVQSWRKTLVNVCNLPGWELNNNPDSRESRCIKQVVNTILNKLFPNEDLTGVGTRLQDLKLKSADSSLSSHPTSSTPASSSKLGSSKLGKCDVFLSFRREDTGNNFVDHIYSALEQRGILTYMKKETVPLDDPSHLKAIDESRISIIIFSKNFASSSWCLDEVAYIIKSMYERELIVMPLFYHVETTEVRKQLYSYNQAFSKYESENNNKVDTWREALKYACDLLGWDIYGGPESKFIKKVVDTTFNRLFPDKGLIGIQTQLEDLKYGASSSQEDVEHLRIPLQDILLATNTFSNENIIAGGGFGKVYQGRSQQHGIIAVKQLDRSSWQGEHEFMMEIALLSAYKHDNLVSLVGFCDQDGEKILVYKYESKGSLDKHLHNKDLTWIQRLRICLDAARGLKYLHDDVGLQHRILHRDVKSANILLDRNLKAKISDFGLSKIALANVPCTILISIACGTLGYVDPQYIKLGILSQKSDVYSFGVVLFEVLFGRLVSVAENPDNRHFSVKMAKTHYENGTLDEIIHPDLRKQMDSKSLSTFSTIAYQCLKKHGEERPTMSLVMEQLEKVLDCQLGVIPTLKV